MGLDVVVIGGGIGGLALAQGLRRRGVGVSVHERGLSPHDRLQGYRLHIDSAGGRALRSCLPPELFDAFLATCGQPNTGIGIFSHRLHRLIWFETDPRTTADAVTGVKSASRTSLRQVLLAGLDDAVRFDQEFTHFDTAPGGRVRAHFADGSTAIGDVLVGADGARSRVRGQYLPEAALADTGVSGIQGKVWLADDVRARLPAELTAGPVMIPGPHGCGMFLAMHQFQAIPPRLAELVGPEAATQRDYVMWGVLAAIERLPAGVEHLGPAELRDLALTLIRRWHPNLHRLIRDTDLDTVLLTPIRTSRPVGAWPASRVTLLGDAIHSMPPTGGIGANTALRDAELLSTQLSRAAGGHVGLLRAIGDYEAEMRRYGFAAVEESVRNLRRQQATANPLVLAAMTVALGTAGTLRTLRRRGRSRGASAVPSADTDQASAEGIVPR